jgi:hypothetical protein
MRKEVTRSSSVVAESLGRDRFLAARMRRAMSTLRSYESVTDGVRRSRLAPARVGAERVATGVWVNTGGDHEASVAATGRQKAPERAPFSYGFNLRLEPDAAAPSPGSELAQEMGETTKLLGRADLPFLVEAQDWSFRGDARCSRSPRPFQSPLKCDLGVADRNAADHLIVEAQEDVLEALHVLQELAVAAIWGRAHRIVKDSIVGEEVDVA